MGLRFSWFPLLICCLFPLAPAASTDVKSKPIFRVALVDKFYPRDYTQPPERRAELQDALYGIADLDKDRSREPIYHGDVVEMLIQHPRIQVIRYPIPADRQLMDGVLYELRKLQADVPALDVDAILLPYESSTLVSSLDEELQRDKVDQYVDTLRRWGERDQVWATTHAVIRQMETLINDGVEVVTIAGNGGSGMVNTLSFARGVMTVGAVEDELRYFVANNAFVNSYERAAYMFRRVDDHNGKARGYDLDGDGCPEVALTKLTGYHPERTRYPREGWRAIKGSSFAAPRALRNALVGSLDSGICLGN